MNHLDSGRPTAGPAAQTNNLATAIFLSMERELSLSLGTAGGITAFTRVLDSLRPALAAHAEPLGSVVDIDATLPGPGAHNILVNSALDNWRARVFGWQKAAYAEDAAVSSTPWDRWEWQHPTDRGFRPCTRAIDWNSGYAYRRPPVREVAP